MSWFSFFFLPQAYFSSHLHHSPIPLSLICYLVFFSQCLFSPMDSPGCFFCVFLLCSAFTFTFIYFFFRLKNFNYVQVVPKNPTHCTTMGCPQKLLMFCPCGSSSVSQVWKLYENLYQCPQARHTKHQPRLCGRMFKWEAFPHTRCITREQVCKHTCAVVWKVAV